MILLASVRHRDTPFSLNKDILFLLFALDRYHPFQKFIMQVEGRHSRSKVVLRSRQRDRTPSITESILQ